MRTPFMKTWLTAVLWVLALGSTVARAELDAFALGNGHNGALSVTTAGNIINSYAPVTAPLAPGDTSILVGACAGASACFAAGDLILVHQTTGYTPVPASGSPAALDLTNDPVGRWELARLASVSGSTLNLTAALIHSYAATVTQVIRVPEYTTVNITTAGRITATPWNGSVGGIIAFLATGTVSNAGQINASTAGFRGGQYVDDPTGDLGCSGLDEPATQGAQKGEGVVNVRYGSDQTGRGNVANGAGAGVCYKSGGGGGGNYGAGGVGGRSDGSIDGARTVGGLGGSALTYALLDHFTFGGGGGAGHSADGTGVSGGRGGGAIFIRANQLTGSGSIVASGGGGGSTASDGGSGGGAGGSVYLRFASTAACGSVNVAGGVGGNTNSIQVGPGGGGAGGRVLLQAATGATCNSIIGGASPGVQQDPSAPDGSSYGAVKGGDGKVFLDTTGYDITPPDTSITSSPPNPSASASATFTFGSTETGVTYECRLDSGAFTVCTNPVTFPGLSDGSHTLQVRARDATGNVDPTPASYTWTVDTTPPDTSITASPPNPSASSSATFSFSSPEAGVTYECSLDGSTGPFTACSNPATFTGLSDGSHTLYVRAKDAAGNVDPTPASYTWTVDTTPPDTSITASPPNPSASSSATFSFSSPEAGVTYECKLDTGAFTACTNPVTFTGLSEGSHTLQVRAKDAAGNVDPTPASYTWTVDTIAPDTSITASPPNPSASSSATFSFSSPEAGVTYECKLDTGAFTACTNPVTFTGLGEGSHTLEVRAKDAAGNVDPTPASYTWTVDTVAPDTSITASPPNPSASSSATFSFSSPEAGVTYECKLDTGAFTACTNPVTFTGLGEGSHTLQVRAKDAAGNVDPTPASYTWTVDTVAPDTSITASPPNPSASSSATFSFSSNEAGVTYECKLDTGAFTACTNPVSFTGLGEGSHSLQVRAVDAAGNVDPTPASYTWTVDTLAPDTTIVAAPPSISASSSATFSFSSNESGVTYLCRLDGALDFTPCTNPVTFTGLADGSHTLQVSAQDAAGNVDPTPAIYSWTVDTSAPDTSITASPPNPSASSSATFSFGSNEAGVTYECSLDSGAFTACTNPVTFTGLGEGSHTLQVRAKDAAGNVDPTPASATWTVDLTAPETTIVSGPPSSSSSTSATFDFSSPEAGVTYECKLDGATSFTPCSDPVTFTGLSDGPHTLEVRARDTAGNVDPSPASYSWTVDTTAPDTTIVTGPAAVSGSTSATFDFSSTDTGATYQCSLDGTAFTSCTDPVTFSSLGEGSHTLQVRAVDAVGNVDPTPATYSWTVDTTAPAAPVVDPALAGKTFDTATPVISGTAEPGSTVTVIIDGHDVGTTTADASGNWSYVPTTPLTPGSHTAEARATDAAGNTGPTSTQGRTFTVVEDTQAPETSIVSGPPDDSQEHSATFTFGSNEPGVTYECNLDGAGWVPCSSPVTFDNLADGEHTLQVRARDSSGNVDATPETRTWTVRSSTAGREVAFLGDGFGCSATGGDSSLVLMGLGTFLALARRKRRG